MTSPTRNIATKRSNSLLRLFGGSGYSLPQGLSVNLLSMHCVDLFEPHVGDILSIQYPKNPGMR